MASTNRGTEEENRGEGAEMAFTVNWSGER